MDYRFLQVVLILSYCSLKKSYGEKLWTINCGPSTTCYEPLAMDHGPLSTQLNHRNLRQYPYSAWVTDKTKSSVDV